MICGISTLPENSISVLGIKIDALVKFNEHIVMLNGKLRSILYLYRNIAKLDISAPILRNLIKSTLVSKLSYGLSIFGSVANLPKYQGSSASIRNKSLMIKLQLTLKHLARISIKYAGYYQNMPIDQLYKESKFLSLNQMNLFSKC